MNKLLKVFCAIVLLQTSCKTDVDLLAPYKETMVVYGLLDPSDSVHYMRINRAFLGEGNAYTYAQNPDSINYRDTLDVKLERYKNDIKIGTIDLIRIEGPSLDSGIFASQPNILYKTIGNDSIYQDSEYKLVATHTQTGLVVTSQCKIVGRITNFMNPSSVGSLDIVNPNGFVAKWTAGINAKVYDLTLHFKYFERDKLTGDLESKSFDWLVSTAITQGSTNIIAMSIPASLFYQTIRKNIQPNSAVERRLDGIDFIYTGGTEEFYTYYQVNKPSSGVVQTIPTYTNIDGGVGIFTSAYTQILKDRILNSDSFDSLFVGQYTGSLGFIP